MRMKMVSFYKKQFEKYFKGLEIFMFQENNLKLL